MQKLIVILAGVGVGIVATALCFLLGLQSSGFESVAACTLATSIAAALAGDAAAGCYRRRIKQDRFTRLEVEQAIGAVGDRYALNPNQNVLIALGVIEAKLQRSATSGCEYQRSPIFVPV